MNSHAPSAPDTILDESHRILVVDDNRAIHEDFRKILAAETIGDDFDDEDAAFFGTLSTAPRKSHFELDYASQGREALERVIAAKEAGRPYSVVFMDVRMPPGWDGIETTVRLWEVNPDMQVVICTAYSDYSWEQMVSRLGRTDRLLILKKPFDIIEVVQCAHALSGKWSLLQQTRKHSESLESMVRARTAELMTSRDAALESARIKSRFLANMSHEIRTPMNGVIGMAELLGHTQLDRDQREYIDTIRSSAALLMNIINDILDSSKIEAGELSFEKRDFDLAAIVEGTLDIVGGSAHGKQLEIAGCLEKEVPRKLRGDPGRLRQILTNILGNAVKFTDRGEVILSVSTLAESENHAQLRFEVRDTGIGIPANLRERIFEPFIQADESDSRKYGGTGLGLTICRQIVEALGGRLGVESKPGSGSTFWFTIRFEKQQAPAPHAATPVIPALLRILVVDDNAASRDVLQRQLSSLRLRSEACASAGDALARLRSESDPFHAALIDMQMPGTNGLELARRIKADPLIAGTRLIILSSLGDHLTEAEIKSAGIEAYLVKPLKESRLRAALASMFRGGPFPEGKLPGPGEPPRPAAPSPLPPPPPPHPPRGR